MNALFELIGERMSGRDYDKLMSLDPHVFDNCKVERKQVTRDPDPSRDIVKVFPSVETIVAKDFAKSIKFAKVYYHSYYDEEDEGPMATLRSTRTAEDELKFLKDLESINYDSGYGSQELFGIIMFKDGTWLRRHEYDGSEYWEKIIIPQESDYFNL